MAKNRGRSLSLIIGSLLVIALATAARGMKREKTSCIGGNSCNRYNRRLFRLDVKKHMETIFSAFNKLEKEKMTNEKKDSCIGDNSCYSGYGSEDVSSTSCNGNAACSMMG